MAVSKLAPAPSEVHDWTILGLNPAVSNFFSEKPSAFKLSGKKLSIDEKINLSYAERALILYKLDFLVQILNDFIRQSDASLILRNIFGLIKEQDTQ